MAEEMRNNRPMYQQGQRPEGMDMPEHSGHRRGGKMGWMVLVLVVVVLVVLGVLFRDKIFMQKGAAGSGYQAIFLTNGQVYFGKMSQSHGEYITLTDIFYLQVTQPPLQGSQQTGQQAAAAQAQAQPQLSLVKLGNELHGPEDVMKINRDQVLFYEDMKADGKVTQAIQEYKKNPNPAPSATPPAATPTPTPPVNR